MIPTEPLYREIRAVPASARSGAYRAVNAAMVRAYWHVGRLIVEHEQGGRKRAAYGEAVLDDLSQRLSADFGRGFDVRNLRYMRQFYLAFPIDRALTPDSHADDKRNALRSKSDRAGKRNAARSELAIRHSARDESPALRPELSWTHYRRAALVHPPTRTPDLRALLRTPAGQPHEGARPQRSRHQVGHRGTGAVHPGPVRARVHGFSFVARQKRLRFEDEDFYVDLVFYNYLLRCFVLIDLKVGKLTHQDIGQMESYVRMFDAHARPKDDNPTIGLILCSKKNEAIAKYSVLSEARQIFAAKYVKVLPSERDLTREIERERRLTDARHHDEAKARRRGGRAESPQRP